MEETKAQIVVAEDDEEDYLFVLESLKNAGLFGDLTRVTDGEALIEHLRSCQTLPALVVLDLNMPKVDGREALKIMRGDPLLRGIPVAVLTSSPTEEDVVRAYDLRVEYYVRKPVEFEQMLDIIRAVEAAQKDPAAAHARRLPAV